VLADGAIVEIGGQEADEWELFGESVLRGRSSPTTLARPKQV
jgi:hypothetical protein